jgi:hypothetical protein
LWKLSWHIRLLTKLLDLPKSHPKGTNIDTYRDRISKVITGTIRTLFDKSQPCNDPDNRAFRILTLFCASRYVDAPQIKGLLQDRTDLAPESDITKIHEYPVAHLLQYCHRMVLKDEEFQEKFTIPYEHDDEEIQRCKAGALRKNYSSIISSELDTLNESVFEDFNEIIAREQKLNQVALLQVELITQEEKLNQVALLQVELFDNTKDHAFFSNLVDDVAERLKRRETMTPRSLPAWGYRCLDHSLQIELAIAKIGLESAKIRLEISKTGPTNKPWEDFRETVPNAYDDCLQFMRSDGSFLRSWDSTELTWTSNHWNLDCSSVVSSSFLSILTMEPITIQSMHTKCT